MCLQNIKRLTTIIECNFYLALKRIVLEKQKKVAQIAEMIHTASLVHDDVIDVADSRRGKPSVNVLWGQKKVS